MPNLEAHVMLTLPGLGQLQVLQDYLEAEFASLAEGTHCNACSSLNSAPTRYSVSPKQVRPLIRLNLGKAVTVCCTEHACPQDLRPVEGMVLWSLMDPVHHLQFPQQPCKLVISGIVTPLKRCVGVPTLRMWDDQG